MLFAVHIVLREPIDDISTAKFAWLIIWTNIYTNALLNTQISLQLWDRGTQYRVYCRWGKRVLEPCGWYREGFGFHRNGCRSCRLWYRGCTNNSTRGLILSMNHIIRLEHCGEKHKLFHYRNSGKVMLRTETMVRSGWGYQGMSVSLRIGNCEFILQC